MNLPLWLQYLLVALIVVIGLAPATVSRLLDRLEEAELVVRDFGPGEIWTGVPVAG